MKFDVIILAGGLGTRLRSVVADVPKPMAPVAGRPFLDLILEKLPLANVATIILSVGHKHEVIKEHYGDVYFDTPVRYAVEEEPLGTGGGIKLALQMAKQDHTLIVNGDTLFDIDYEQFWQSHYYAGNDLTLALKQMDHPDRYGTVLLDQHRVVRFQEKTPGLKYGLINGGIYWVRTDIVEEFPSSEKFSFEQDFLEKKVNDLNMGGYIDTAGFIDIGIPEDYERAQTLFAQ